jgi:hypothetical protein
LTCGADPYNWSDAEPEAILLDQILDELLLMLVHLAGQRDNDERKWIQERAHRCTLSRDGASHFSQCFKSLRVFAHNWSGRIR